MSFIASIDTLIYESPYQEGEQVDTTGWTRKQLLQMLGLGLITALPYHRQAYAGVTTDTDGLATIGHGAGFVPTLVVVSGNPTAYALFWGADLPTATTVRVRFTDVVASGAFVGITGAFTALFYR